MLEKMLELVTERGERLSRDDIARLQVMSVEVPLEDSEQLDFFWESVALIVNHPTYEGDAEPI